jgi:hypothetical protein
MELFNIISIALTIFFGILAIFAFIDQKRSKYSISFGLIESYSFMKKLDSIDVKLTHKNIEFDNALVLKTVFCNNGKEDIDNYRIKKPISIILPQNYQCLDFAISDKENLSKASASKIKDNEMMLRWELLKPGESIKTEAFITYKNTGETNEPITAINFFDSITLDYRITNIGKIKKTQPRELKLKRLFFLFYLALFGCILLLLGIPELTNLGQRYALNYDFVLNGDTTNTYFISPKNSNEIKVFKSNDWDEPLKRMANLLYKENLTTTYNITTFNKLNKKVIITAQDNTPIIPIIYVVIGVLFLFYVAFYIIKNIINVKLKKVVS